MPAGGRKARVGPGIEFEASKQGPQPEERQTEQRSIDEAVEVIAGQILEGSVEQGRISGHPLDQPVEPRSQERTADKDCGQIKEQDPDRTHRGG